MLRYRPVLIALVGLLIGLSVNFRLPNLLLSAGYFLFLAGAFMLAHQGGFPAGRLLRRRIPDRDGADADSTAINAGSPFATTYGAEMIPCRPN